MDDKQFEAIQCRNRINQDLAEYQIRHEVEEEQKKLRDQFAMQAMNAIIIGNNADDCAICLGAAKDAYDMADYMLEARLIKS